MAQAITRETVLDTSFFFFFPQPARRTPKAAQREKAIILFLSMLQGSFPEKSVNLPPVGKHGEGIL